MDDFRMYTIDQTGRVIFKPPKPPQLATGFAKLFQIVLLALFSNPGSNAFYPERGGGFSELIGTNIDPDDDTEIIAEITARLEKIKAEIIESQASLTGESPDAKLRDIQVISIERGTNIDDIMLKFRVVSESGEAYQVIV